jgi:hypothetical protein
LARPTASQAHADDRRPLTFDGHEVDGSDDASVAARPIITKNLHSVDSGFLGDANSLACNRAGAMCAMAIHIRSAGLVTIAPLGREDRQVDLWDGSPLELRVGNPNASVQHIHMSVRTGDAKIVVAPVEALRVIDAVKAPAQIV